MPGLEGHEAAFAPSGSPPSAGFASLEGTVQVKKAGTLEWLSARPDVQLAPGDLVRTGSGAGADVRFANGTHFRLRADSLLCIQAEPPPGVVSVSSSPFSGASGYQCAPLPPPAR